MGWPVGTRATDDLIDAAIWNADLAANLNSVLHPIARKTIDEARTSDTTDSDDATLFAPVGINEVWRFEWWILLTGGAGDLKISFLFPSGTFSCTFAYNLSNDTYRLFNFSSLTSPTGSNDIATISTTIPQLLWVPAIYVGGGTAGDVKIRWSQLASSGTPTTFRAQSSLWGAKVA